MRARHLLILFALCLAALILFSDRAIHDGRYANAEFRLTFVNPDGHPIEGVSLKVENDSGTNFFFFPVTDYLPDHVPVSDKNGVLVFHHVSYSACEFSWETWCGLFQVGRAPKFQCRFFLRDREVFSAEYKDLDGQVLRLTPVKRQWQWPTWPSSELLPKFQGSFEEWHRRCEEFFDFDVDGRLQPEELAALNAATSSKANTIWEQRRKGLSTIEEIEFLLVEKVVTVN